MKRGLIQLFLMFSAASLSAQGVPFIENYTAEDYQAYNINFDIKTGKYGTIFAANFEGLLYYDHAAWSILHTSGITRVTTTYCDKKGNIWAGGYNYLGRIDQKPNGELYLKQIGKPDLFRGEVLEMWEKDDTLMFVVNNGKAYKVIDDEVTIDRTLNLDVSRIGLTDIVQIDSVESKGTIKVLTDITQEEPMDNGLKALVKKGHGISIVNESGQELYSITEKNGLITNNVSWVNYDGHGRLWGASEDGLFTLAVPSAYTHFTTFEGLKGEVLCIADFKHQKYIGTNNGLFLLKNNSFEKIAGINHACWELLLTAEGLMVSTTNGIYLVTSEGMVRQLTINNSMALLDDGDQYYSGETDGVWLIKKGSRERKKVCPLEKVSKIMKDAQGTIWLKSTYGEVWNKTATAKTFTPYKEHGTKETISTFVMVDGKVKVINAEDTAPFSYPFFSYTDASGVTWLTNHEGKQLYRWKDGKRLTDLDQLLYPFAKSTIRAIFCQDKEIWLGTDNELVIINTSLKDPIQETLPRMLIRRITLGNDSILWGGYGDMPKELPLLDSNSHNLTFVYSLDYEAMVGETVFRYRLNDGEWSAWADEHDVDFLNLTYGSYTFYVQGRDAFGRETEIASIDFKISYPFYMRWYMNILYVILLGVLIYIISQLRMRKLERDKMLLEKIVEERTAEVKSAQNQLIKQEKMVTVGKLTQGLIDRILNPLNYINNFSKLSEGLVKDVKANIEDEKEHMDKENYEDTMDVLDMLTGNLKKVGEHGQNTTRTLKAMEEMLKDRSGGIVNTDLCSILRQNEEMFGTYYAKDINEYHIHTTFDYPTDPVYIKVNPEQLSKVIISMLSNSIYAIVKKAKRIDYQPEISLKAGINGDIITITVYDTGIGMEEHILDKIFDPFFTTKTTGEASGIGLYLSHDIIQNYGGDITARSVKDEFTEFTITLPIQTASAYGETN
jgi:signal transduction histidine kinase